MLEDVEASNAFSKNMMWKTTDFLRHVLSEKKGIGPVTLTYVREHMQLVSSGKLAVVG